LFQAISDGALAKQSVPSIVAKYKTPAVLTVRRIMKPTMQKISLTTLWYSLSLKRSELQEKAMTRKRPKK
jgi:hypothetical protein